jgi:predicted RNA-binding Zn ribbon-like protein
MNITDDFIFVGGHRALDFINTVDDQDKQRTINRIAGWPSFLGWGEASSMFNEKQLDILKNNIPRPVIATLLIEINELKELSYQALKFIMAENITQNIALEKLECRIKIAIGNSSLVKEEVSFKWATNTRNSGWVVDLLVLSIADLLCDKDLTKLRECKRCTWMFLNSGRGKGRQWCNMSTCGNRAKSASFRGRHHSIDQ